MATNYLNAIKWGVSTGGTAGTGEDSTTLGLPRLDIRDAPDQYHISGSQISNIVSFCTTVSQFMAGGTRLKVLQQTSNPFSTNESGYWIDINGYPNSSNQGSNMLLQGVGVYANISGAASTSINPANINVANINLQSGVNITSWSIVTGVQGQIVTVNWIQSGGTHSTLAGAASNIKFIASTYLGADHSAPTLTNSAGKIDTQVFVYSGTNWIEIYRNFNN